MNIEEFALLDKTELERPPKDKTSFDDNEFTIFNKYKGRIYLAQGI